MVPWVVEVNALHDGRQHPEVGCGERAGPVEEALAVEVVAVGPQRECQAKHLKRQRQRVWGRKASVVIG